LGGVGLSAILGYLDFVLLPALGIFIMITIYALWKRQAAWLNYNHKSPALNADIQPQKPCQLMLANGPMTARGVA